MENKNVGWLILGIAAVIVVIVFLFDSALRQIVASTCNMAQEGIYCPMNVAITQQTYLALAIVAVLVVIGLVLLFSKPKEKIVFKKVKEKTVEKKIDLSGFRSEERQVYNLVKENGTIFQADLIDKTGFGKAKVTRIIDRLEGHGLVERKRRGMTNVVVIKS